MPHIHEKIDFTVEVFVVYGTKVLLRKHDKYDIWLGVGGHVELYEDPNEAALREVKEEVGLDVQLAGMQLPFAKGRKGYKELIPPVFLNRHHISDTHEHIALTYFAKTDSDNVIPENKTDEWKWFSLDDLEKNEEGIADSICFYAKAALAKLGA